MLDDPFLQAAAKQVVSHTFLKGLHNSSVFDSNPIFAILHEAIYAQGSATCWACHVVQKENYSHYDDFEDFRFYGEMIFPWMFDEISELKHMKEAAEILASYEDWPDLYDPDVLKRNTVPTACVVYYNDMFVNTRFSRETIDFVPNMKGWYTSEYEHCGIRSDGEKIFSRLIDFGRGEVER